MNEKLELLLKMSEEELRKKLKSTYEAQKLPPILRTIARISELLVCILLSFYSDETIYAVGWGIIGVITLYRLIRPKKMDSIIYEELEELVEGIENFKKYRNKKLDIEYNEKIVTKTEKGIKRYLPVLLKTSIILKIFALIPVLNLVCDEVNQYVNKKGALTFLIDGSIFTNGLKMFLNKNLEKDNIRKSKKQY